MEDNEEIVVKNAFDAFHESQQDQAQRRIQAQQRQIEALQQQKYQQPQQESQLKSCKNILISDKKDY
jgi:hypothetical protein